jgi:D-beta-D-heptose 7-phosphate kinase / D-beta-D-heptose 1-phosphate adenosyltransferase
VVDLVTVFGEETPLSLIEAPPGRPRQGADYALNQVVGANIVRQSGGRVILVDLLAGEGTTATIERVRAPKRVTG